MRFRQPAFFARVTLLLLVTLCTGAHLFGQAVAIANITGRVVDPQGAIVPGVQIKLTATETGLVHNAVTNGDGLYTLTNLPIGSYTLQASVQGFQTYVQRGIVLQVNDKLQINIPLTLGEVTDRVEVQANAASVQTQQSSVSQVIDGRRIVDLPLNGRDPTQLITISGAAVNHSDGTNTGSKSFFSAQSIAIAGGMGDQTNYLLDGGDNNDSFTNVNLPFPFPDALAEFSVETSSLPARNGLHPGGLVNAVTRSGSNNWHGSAFEFVRNGAVNATNFFGRPDSLKRNQFGGTLGGKVITDKLFFFFGFQQSNIRQDPTNQTAYVPTAAMLAGDFSGCYSGPGTIVSPGTFDPAAVALTKYLPTGSTLDPCGKVQYGSPVKSNEQQYVGRGDWTLSSKHSLYGRYFIDMYKLAAFWDPKDALVTTTSGNYEKAQSLTFGDTYVLSPSMVNSVHATFTRRRDDRGPNASGINMATLGVNNVYQGTPNYLQISVGNNGFSVGSGAGALGTFNVTQYQEAEDLDWIKGKHQMAFGVDLIRSQDNQNNHYEDNGSWLIDGRYNQVGSQTRSLMDFLQGKIYRFEQTLPQQNAIRQTILGVYGQDTFHATPKLVLNFGLRWEPMMYPYDYFHRGSTFSRANFDSATRSTVYVNAPPGTLFYGDPGVTPSYTDNRWTNFSPRLGVVYNPDGEGRTTFRAGAAMMYDSPGTFLNYRVIANNLPNGATINNQNGPYQFSNPWATVPGGNPFPLSQIPPKDVAFPLAGSQVIVPRHIHSPIVYQYNVGMQHLFGTNWVFSLTYLGDRMQHTWIGNEVNPAVYIPGTSTGVANSCGSLVVGRPAAGAPCSSTSNTQNRRILSLANPNYGQYYSTQVLANDEGYGNYNGVLTSIEHRFVHNYTLLANYTWSKCMNVGPMTSLGVEGVVQNPYNLKSDYGYCTADVRHIFNLSVVADSTWHGGRLASALLGGWQIAPLVRATSGLPFNISTGADNSRTGINLDRPNVVPDKQVYLSSPHLHSGIPYLSRAAFTPNPIGTFGNAMHFGYHGPNYAEVDMSVSRDFHLHESLVMRLRVDGFNVLNHPNFNPPSALTYSSTTFGQITTAQDPRILQGAVKFSF
jgi:hypothetical protein